MKEDAYFILPNGDAEGRLYVGRPGEKPQLVSAEEVEAYKAALLYIRARVLKRICGNCQHIASQKCLTCEFGEIAGCAHHALSKGAKP